MNQPITQDKSKQLTVSDTVRKMEPEFAALLKTSGTDIKKFMNNALLTMSEKPEIKSGEVTSRSVFNVCSRAANDGVVLDGKEAALVVGNVKRNGQWVKEAQYRLMAGGVMKMIRRSPDIERVACQLIYVNDDFHVDFVTDEAPIVHKLNPAALKQGRGEVVGVYFVAKLRTGEWTSPEIMSADEVNEVRDKFASKDKDGNFSKMWRDAWGEAARKTVLHRAVKRLPLGEREQEALNHGDADAVALDGETGEIIEMQPAKRKTTRAAEAVKAKMAIRDAEESEPQSEPDDSSSDAEYTDVDNGGDAGGDDGIPL